MHHAWTELPLLRHHQVKVHFNSLDINWLKKQPFDYIQQQVATGKCRGSMVGEISIHTLNNLGGLIVETEQDQILEAISLETGIINWGSEGKSIKIIPLEVCSHTRLREIKLMCENWSQKPNRILKGIILKDLGYIVYDSHIPRRNTLAIVQIREILRDNRLALVKSPFNQSILWAALSKLQGNVHDPT